MAKQSKWPFSRFLGPILSCLSPSSEQTVIYEGDSEYNHIAIMEQNGLRTMYLGPLVQEAQTSISLSDPESPVFEYPGLMLLALALGPLNRDILMLGLGGGYIPKLFQSHLPSHNLTVVELDPQIAELASVYFDFNPGQNVSLVISDGLEYVARARMGSYDQIWLDAFGGEYIPPHLATSEFLELCRMRLKPRGLLVQNLHQTQALAYRKQLHRTFEVFGQAPLVFGGTRCGNSICLSLHCQEERLPRKEADILSAVKAFGKRVGPYDLTKECAKLLNIF